MTMPINRYSSRQWLSKKGDSARKDRTKARGSCSRHLERLTRSGSLKTAPCSRWRKRRAIAYLRWINLKRETVDKCWIPRTITELSERTSHALTIWSGPTPRSWKRHSAWLTCTFRLSCQITFCQKFFANDFFRQKWREHLLSYSILYCRRRRRSRRKSSKHF